MGCLKALLCDYTNIDDCFFWFIKFHWQVLSKFKWKDFFDDFTEM